MFKLSKVLETISASFAARICDRVAATNRATRLGQRETARDMQYEILGLLAAAEGRDVGEPAVVMLIE